MNGKLVIHFFAMSDADKINNLFFLIKFTNDSVISNTVSPKMFQVSYKRLCKILRIFLLSQFFRKKLKDSFSHREIYLLPFLFEINIILNGPLCLSHSFSCVLLSILQKDELYQFLFLYALIAQEQLNNPLDLQAIVQEVVTRKFSLTYERVLQELLNAHPLLWREKEGELS